MSNTEQSLNQNSDGSIPSVGISPQQWLLAAILVVIVPIAAVLLILNLFENSRGKTSGHYSEAVVARIQPVAGFSLAAAQEEGEKTLKTGEEVYNITCAACHSSGVAGAPTFGDSAAWASYIADGYDTMLHVALTGKGAMPAKGGNSNLEDIEVARAVVYMANHSGANIPEPTADGEEATPASDSAAANTPAATNDNATAASNDSAVSTATEAPAAADAGNAELTAAGKKLYDSVCFTCHAAGIANAPITGDKDSWAPYIATGMDTMLEKAISGVGAMPPRGTAMSASDDELRAAIQYMVDQSK